MYVKHSILPEIESNRTGTNEDDWFTQDQPEEALALGTSRTVANCTVAAAAEMMSNMSAGRWSWEETLLVKKALLSGGCWMDYPMAEVFEAVMLEVATSSSAWTAVVGSKMELWEPAVV
ncbi:hypothetical protein B5M09_011101 [Aphanomyces astaci]|uniref:Uncharacterized protein n=1 Tax=Aphanomyces astaci TaxID=112090 RepID=A0A425DH50_APHAT|nr:hypothetical protein B5M09_011101 [Aphanomyces astaci]